MRTYRRVQAVLDIPAPGARFNAGIDPINGFGNPLDPHRSVGYTRWGGVRLDCRRVALISFAIVLLSRIGSIRRSPRVALTGLIVELAITVPSLALAEHGPFNAFIAIVAMIIGSTGVAVGTGIGMGYQDLRDRRGRVNGHSDDPVY